MTRSTLATALGILVLLLSGCGSDSESAPAKSDTEWTNYVPLADPNALSDLSRSGP